MRCETECVRRAAERRQPARPTKPLAERDLFCSFAFLTASPACLSRVAPDHSLILRLARDALGATAGSEARGEIAT
eukprot:1181774-Prorocentrum_minimum.AAC.2